MALLQEIKVPLLSVNDTTLTVVEILMKPGSKVTKGDVVMVFETSKTTYDVVAEQDGYIDYQCKEGSDYEVNKVVATIYSDAAYIQKPVEPALNGSAMKAASSSPQTQEPVFEGETLYSRKAEELIAKHAVDRSRFLKRDFVSVEDVELELGLKPVEVPVQTATITQKKAAPAPAAAVKYQKLSSNKKREIEYLSAVQSTGLTSTLHTTVSTSGILKNVNQSLKYLKNSLLPIILYEGSRLLKKHPLLNAYIQDDQLGIYEQVNIGFAIDAEKGLKVLKIAESNTKTVNQIESEIMELSDAYLNDKLTVDSLTDITFTVTDLSSEGISFFQPLVNMHNSAILGVSAIDEKLSRCNLSITFDHRVTEGKLAAVFLRELKERLESYGASTDEVEVSGIECLKCHKTLAEDLSGIGFAKCVSASGKEAYVCQSCFKGF